ncbi:FecR family protein [Ancylomarina euxinus]|uniref:FecR family protein n=1 Tax=Ancylomarina euxinus TaxID=2283627 RepID=A0A425XZ15_9BACT|nr:FecR family protein [Ancylomarina euxinus]MCZ4695581.1 FecR family protein [Ancylomarina euxinus]MUP15962.1 DUF4974 domain-containing protein [Ancylomarina euxinus]RRG20404.1 FecR family protein [Ancylomarina euxinus]
MKYQHEDIEKIIQLFNKPKGKIAQFLVDNKDDKELVSLYHELRKNKEALLDVEKIDMPNVELEWQRIRYSIQKKQKRKWFRMIAASLVLILSVSFLLVFELPLTSYDPIAQTMDSIIHGSSKAILTTSTGESHYLDGSKDLSINEQSGIEILAGTDKRISYKYQNGQDSVVEKMVFNSLKTPRGGEYQIVLADGTKVWLNSESELKYPLKFIENERAVELIGEAYFEVAKNPEQTFIVKTHHVNTKVLGTHFNVCAYPNEDANITLVEGKVGLENKLTGNEHLLSPGENAKLETSSRELLISQVDVKKYTAWRNGYFYFERERLEDILLKLERWYDFKVFYQNANVKDFEFRMRADRTVSFDEVIKRLELTGRINISVKGKALVISDVNRN